VEEVCIEENGGHLLLLGFESKEAQGVLNDQVGKAKHLEKVQGKDQEKLLD
jgi:hypothetical protein